ESLRVDLQGAGVAGTDDLHDFRSNAGGFSKGFLHLFGGVIRCRHAHLGAALEIDAQGEATDGDEQDRDDQQNAGDPVPQFGFGDEVNAAVTGVEAVEPTAFFGWFYALS